MKWCAASRSLIIRWSEVFSWAGKSAEDIATILESEAMSKREVTDTARHRDSQPLLIDVVETIALWVGVRQDIFKYAFKTDDVLGNVIQIGRLTSCQSMFAWFGTIPGMHFGRISYYSIYKLYNALLTLTLQYLKPTLDNAKRET